MGPGTAPASATIRINNFDLIRLLAAAQVVVRHGIEHLQIDSSHTLVNVVLQAVRYFPGVPVFFFVSGFLITLSYDNSNSLENYARNRLLRIYPALIVCALVSLAVLFVVGYLPREGASLLEGAAWTLGQITFVQFYNPDFMRGFGVGVLNGSLWTITVELQFYVVAPLVYVLCGTRGHGTARLVGLLLVFMAINAGYWHMEPEESPTLLLKLFGVTFLPWFYMFLTGALAYRCFDLLHRWLAGRVLLVGAAYVIVHTVGREVLGWNASNDIHPIIYLALALFVFSMAYTAPTLSERLLRRNDISYGIYIYHMPVVNTLRHLGASASPNLLIVTFAITILMATLSWKFVERPCLRLKKKGAVVH